MRPSFLMVLSLSSIVFGCGSSSNPETADFSAVVDLASDRDLSVAAGDIKAVTPFNMPGMVDCYGTLRCPTAGAAPICCDAPADGGFGDTCVATVSACTGTSASAHAYQCGQAADCASGMVCCGATAMSSGGSLHFTGTTCETSCASTETQLCVTTAECKTTSAHCIGQSLSGRDVGLCQ